MINKIGFDLIKKYPNIFYNFHKELSYNDEPSFYQYSINFRETESNDKSPAIATGTSFIQEFALEKMFGEMIERYSLSMSQYHILIKAKYNNKEKFVSPLSFLAFSDRQLKKSGIKKQDIEEGFYTWEKCYDVISMEECYVPAQLVYIPYGNNKDEYSLQYPTSSGAACGFSLEDSIYRGICELIERDAFTISYLNKIPSPQINLRNINDNEINSIIERIQRYNLEVYLIVTTLDLPIFSVAAIIVDRTGLGPAISIGMKAGLDKKSVIIGALEESLMTRAWIRDQIITNPFQVSVNNITTLEERAFYWYPKSMIKHLDFWLENNRFVEYDYKEGYSSGNLLNLVKEVLKEKRINLFFSEITNDLFRSYHVKVVKVISPELQQLYLDENNKYLGKDRIYNVPRKLGFLKKTENQLFKIPHPFL